MPKLKVGTVFPTDAEDAQIRAGIVADPDTYEVTSAEDWTRMRPLGRPKATSPKVSVTIRYSAEVLKWWSFSKRQVMAGKPAWTRCCVSMSRSTRQHEIKGRSRF
ncbi:hypothetical protein [Thiothrix lacustris]|uniref:hypothetical protein n=1 Tax=Thiothrix lacustris TaxID=525917 RepID=UPI0027E54DBD|nr:hypothetical protein [Thiothrix lacustris]WMP18323.1 hypothetical protein RCS87_04505 [Thiothrix lacustris]